MKLPILCFHFLKDINFFPFFGLYLAFLLFDGTIKTSGRRKPSSEEKTRTKMAADGTRKPCVLVLPYPAQGHISPVAAFSKFLASKGLHITVITTTQLSKSSKFSSSSSSSINIQTISDGSEDNQNQTETFEEYLARFKRCVSQSLAKFLDEQFKSGRIAKAIVYDSLMHWVSGIARGRGLLTVPFFTQSCSVCSVYYHLKRGLLKLPYEDPVVPMPALPRSLEVEDLPSFPKIMDPNNTIMNLLADQFSNLKEVDLVFFNTFDKLENEIIEWMSSTWPIKTIGPTISLLQTSEEINDQKDHMISVFEPTCEACIEWLDSKETNSVLYVSFGSAVSLQKEQMEELAFGLALSNCNFLWVVRSSEENKLPPAFVLNLSDKGFVVEWCSQPRVLAHPSVSCFMTHCGWNSFLEALSVGVPIIGMGQWADQKMNAKFIEDVWNVGTRVESGEFKREEIAKCVTEMVHGDKGKVLKRNACKWKELVGEAVEKGGSSARNVEDFVTQIFCS
ncbi:mogroside I-E synthase-like isoform X1 [Primulina huaijiensis]|uniref:mogroside I-E synthase-like isoform X1 n=2 Tax=Primulina huaijiensis TaxID=1492673 RepID=UPI003CC78291